MAVMLCGWELRGYHKVCLASHWPYVTDSVVIPTLQAQWPMTGRWAPHLGSRLDYGTFYLTLQRTISLKPQTCPVSFSDIWTVCANGIAPWNHLLDTCQNTRQTFSIGYLLISLGEKMHAKFYQKRLCCLPVRIAWAVIMMLLTLHVHWQKVAGESDVFRHSIFAQFWHIFSTQWLPCDFQTACWRVG